MLTTPRAAALAATILANALLVLDARAQITRMELEVVESPAFGGESFGEVGRYERLRGLAYGEIDPDDPRHGEIVNLERAPRNDSGLVEYSTTLEIYRPIGHPALEPGDLPQRAQPGSCWYRPVGPNPGQGIRSRDGGMAG